MKIMKRKYIRKTIALIAVMALMCAPASAFAAGNTITKAGVTVYEATGAREMVCEKMNTYAEAPWTIEYPIEYTYKTGYTAVLPAVLHRGIPYTQFYRSNPDIDVLQENMTLATPFPEEPEEELPEEEVAEDMEEFEAEEPDPVRGLDCSSAAAYALRYATGNESPYNNYAIGATLPYSSSAFLIDGMRSGSGKATTAKGGTITYRDNLTKVGYYGKYTGYTTAVDTQTILAGLMEEGNYDAGTIYDNIYAKIKPGDILVKVKTSGAGHIMVVSSVRLVYSEDGLIDPLKSKVCILDQSAPDRSVFADGALSSWRTNSTLSASTGNRNNVFTFSTIVNSQYMIPVTAWPESTAYTVSYDLDGGTGYVASQTKFTYQPLTLRSNIPVKTGYTFSNWQSTENPAKVNYKAGGTYFDEANDTLKAIWNPNKGKVLYDANGGTGGPSYQTQYYDKPLTITSKEPERDGYAFLGWAYAPNATEPQFTAGSSFTDDARLSNGSGATVTLYAVWRQSISTAEAGLSQTSFKYTGMPQVPSVTLEEGGRLLTENIDYTLTYPENPVAGGTYTITVNGIGDYAGTKDITYTIKKFSQDFELEETAYTVSYGASSFNLDVEAETPVTYKSSNSSVASVDSYGNIAIKGVGTANITVKAASTDKYYSKTKTVTVTVKPKTTSVSSIYASKGALTVKWNRRSTETTGYQIRYSLNSSMSSAKKVTIYSPLTVKTKITGLKSSKKYYIQVRTYTNSGGKTYYSGWSSKKTATVK